MLSGAAYLTVVSELLERAERSIAVLLLFMRAGGRPRHVINRLIDALIAARQRGVDVRVLLDRDADDGPMRSRLVNAAAVDRLDEAGVAVRTGQPGARQHAKVVLVDGRHVLTGSHNWTARSIYRTHDTSVYVSSEPLCQTLAAVFDRWWHESAAAD